MQMNKIAYNFGDEIWSRQNEAKDFNVEQTTQSVVLLSRQIFNELAWTTALLIGFL